MGIFGGVSGLKPWCEYNCENPFSVSDVGRATLRGVPREDPGASVRRGQRSGEACIGD